MSRRVGLVAMLSCFSLAVLVALASHAAAGGVKGMMYQFKAGETYAYAVKIVADRPDATETYEGHIQITIKAIAADGIRLTPSASLPGKVKSKVAPAPAGGKGFKGKSAPGSRSVPITINPPK